MPNKNYKAGQRKESYLTDKLKKEDWDIVQRSAGSHSPVDIFCINKEKKIIKFIQSKRVLNQNMSFIDEKQRAKIEKEFDWLSGEFKVEFAVM